MEIIVAKTAGFCFGVKRAIDLTKDTLNNFSDVYSLGSIVHNKHVNDELKNDGLKFVDDIECVPEGSNIIIRAHGVTPDEIKECSDRKLNIIDTTCPNVKKIHDIVKKHSDLGYKIVVIGDAEHPEVIGILGRAKDYLVVNDIDKVSEFTFDKVCVVSQTTMNVTKSREISEKIKSVSKEAVVFDTVCRATENRQEELKSLATHADYVIVIGDKASANSNRLYEIAKNICNSQFIENVDELCLNFFEDSCKIVVMAGASTPSSLINQVVDKLKSK